MVIRKMVVCVECGKMLGFFEGHYHPTLGKKSLVCSLCFCKVEESVAQWRDFILSNSFNSESPKFVSSNYYSPPTNRFAGVQNRLNAIG